MLCQTIPLPNPPPDRIALHGIAALSPHGNRQARWGIVHSANQAGHDRMMMPPLTSFIGAVDTGFAF